MEQSAAIGIGEEVTGKLDTDVTTTTGLLTSTVTEGRELVDHVRITAPTLCDGVGGVLKGEGTLELSGSDLELRVFTPFSIEVYELYGRLSGTSGVCALNLCTPVEVANLAIEDETGQTQVEGVGVVTFGILTLILQHAVAAELDVLHPGWNLDGGLLLSGFLNSLYFCVHGLWFFCACSANETCHQHRE